MKLPACPECATDEHVSEFTRSAPIPPGGNMPSSQWVAYVCKACGSAYIRLEPSILSWPT